MSTASTSQFALFVASVSAQTGIDPRVLVSWIRSEGAPGNQPGYFNPLNIQTATARSLNVPVVGTGPAGTAIFGSLAQGVYATVREMRSLGLSGFQGQTPGVQIHRIALSPWASSHYGSPAGSNLIRVFQGLFPNAPLGGAPLGPQAATAVASTVGTGSAADWTSISGAGIPGAVATAGAGAIVGVGDALTGWVGSLTRWIEGYAIRVGEVIGGFLLVLVGLYLLARQVGLATEAPPAATTLQEVAA